MTVTDILETRMSVVGLGGYARDILQGGRALGIFKRDLDAAASAELMLGVAAGAASIAIVNSLGKATLAAGQHTAVLTRTTSSFQQFGHAFPQAELTAWTNQVQDATGIARDQVASIAGLYAEYGLTAEQTKKFTKATLEASVALKAQGTSAEQIAKFVGTAQEMIKQGDTKGLSTLARRIGLVVNEARAATDPMGALLDALNRKGGQQAELYKSTLPGAIDTFSSALTRLAQDVGANFEGPLVAFTKFGTSVVDFLDQNPKLVAFAAGLSAVALALKAVNTGLAIFQGLQAAGGVSGLLRGVGGRLLGGGGLGGIISGGGGISGPSLGMEAAMATEKSYIAEGIGTGSLWGLGMAAASNKSGVQKDLLFEMNQGSISAKEIAAARAAGLIGGGGRLAGGGFEAVAGKATAGGLGGAEVTGAAGLGLAGRGLGARALGLLKGPLGIGLALAGAGYGVEALSKGHEATAMGKFGTISAAALKGAGIGAGIGGTIGTFFGPGPGTFLGGLIGGTAGGIGGAISGAAGLEEKEAKRDNTDRMEDLTKSIQDLHAQMQSLNKNLDGLVGDREIRATIGDARILAAFARGIA